MSYVCARAAVGALESFLWSGCMWSAHHHLGTLDDVDARGHAYALGVTSLGAYAMHQAAVDTVDGHGLGLVGTDDNLAFAAADSLAADGLDMVDAYRLACHIDKLEVGRYSVPPILVLYKHQIIHVVLHVYVHEWAEVVVDI